MKKTLIFFFFIFILSNKAYSRNPASLFVSQKNGVSKSTCVKTLPCNEIFIALSKAIPGDLIYIEDGDYTEFIIDAFKGTEDTPLTLKSSGKKVRIIRSSSNNKSRDLIHIRNSDWIILDGINAVNAKRAGVRVNNSHHVTIRNGVYGNNGVWGVFANHSNDLVIERNYCFGSKEQHGIYVSNSGDRPIIRNNKVYNNANCGIHMNGDLSQGEGRLVAGDGLIKGALIENNIIYGNGRTGGAAINMDGVQNSFVLNNLLFDNHAAGIALFKQDGAEGPINVKVIHNTIDMAEDSRWAVIVKESTGAIIIKNNILYNRNKHRESLALGISANLPKYLAFIGLVGKNQDSYNTYSDYNIYGGSNATITLDDNESNVNFPDWQKSKKDQHSKKVILSQLFFDLDKGDYRLKEHSPAIDAGAFYEGVAKDIIGNKRPIGENVDIGAYEFVE